ncbi:MAG: hypothetical protein EBS34_03390 [Flavobacteriales bacterium]|nr:hypothetical protein [Flavobacteriales bacterium]
MIILQESQQQQTFKIVPTRIANINQMVVKDEQTNTTVTSTFVSNTIGDYVNTIIGQFSLKQNHFYTIEFKSNGVLCHKDRIFCTNQNIDTFSVNNQQYTPNSTTNTYIVYE